MPFYDGVRMGLLIIQWYTTYLHMWPNNSTQGRRFVLLEFKVGFMDLVGGSTNETGILNAVEQMEVGQQYSGLTITGEGERQ